MDVSFLLLPPENCVLESWNAIHTTYAKPCLLSVLYYPLLELGSCKLTLTFQYKEMPHWFHPNLVRIYEQVTSTRPERHGLPRVRKTYFRVFIAWLCGGMFGYHRFYLEHHWMGIIYLFTLGLGFMGWIKDVTMLKQWVDEYNADMDEEEKLRKK